MIDRFKFSCLIFQICLFLTSLNSKATNEEYKKILMTGQSEDKIQILSLLQNEGDEGSFQLLCEAMKDPDEDVRIKAVFIVGSIENEKAFSPLLFSSIHDDSLKVRALSAEGLFKLKINTALNYLHSTLEYANKWDLIFLLSRLEQICNPSSAKVVERLLSQQKFKDEVVILKLQKTLKILTGKLNIENIKKSQAIVEEASVALQNGEFEKALLLSKEALSFDNQNPDAFWLKSKINETNKATHQAIKDLENALKFGHLNPGLIYYSIGTLIINTGDFKGSIPYLQLSANIRPLPDVYYQLGSAYFNINNLQSALFNIKKAVELNPDHVQANCALALINQNIGKTNEANFHQTKCNEGTKN